MLSVNEKTPFVHWFYSVSEWEAFMRLSKTKKSLTLLLGSISAGLLVFMILRFSNQAGLMTSLEISAVTALLAGLLQYIIRMYSLKWKSPKMPEVVIVNGTITVNGKSTIFQGNGIWLRKAILKENHNLNILGIAYEWKSGDDIYSDEINIPVPKGKLREAMELLDKLNLKIDILTVFG